MLSATFERREGCVCNECSLLHALLACVQLLFAAFSFRSRFVPILSLFTRWPLLLLPWFSIACGQACLTAQDVRGALVLLVSVIDAFIVVVVDECHCPCASQWDTPSLVPFLSEWTGAPL